MLLLIFCREKPDSSSEEEVTDNEASDEESKPSNDLDEPDGEPTPNPVEVVKKEWTSKEEAKQAFKDLLREKV